MSTTSSTLTSVLSALGGSTGIDVTSAVDAILYADRAPERAWAAQQATLTTQTTAINQLDTEASSLADTLTSLGSFLGPLNTVAATSSNSNVLTATATASTASSSHLVVVTNLASTGSWYTADQTSATSTLTDGTSFDITVGGVSTTISVATGNDNLTELAATINSKSLGVTANIISDSGGSRLALVSTTSGSASDLSITNDTSGLGLTRGNTGKDASITVDGVPITSATNTVSGAIGGVTLNLQSASAGSEINLTIAPDTTAISTALSSFVTTFNTLIADVNSQFDYDSSTNTAGTLSGDSTVQGLQQALLSITNYSSGNSTFPSLTSLGITTNSDGTLTLNTSTLTTALQSNSAAVASFFQGDAFNGFASTLTTTLDSYTDLTQGAFTIDLKSITAEYADLTDQTNSLEVYLSAQQTLLTAQYNAADIAIQQLPQKLKQINALLNPNSTSSS